MKPADRVVLVELTAQERMYMEGLRQTLADVMPLSAVPQPSSDALAAPQRGFTVRISVGDAELWQKALAGYAMMDSGTTQLPAGIQNHLLLIEYKLAVAIAAGRGKRRAFDVVQAQLMRERGQTLEQIAEALGVSSHENVSRALTAFRKKPGWSRFMVIARKVAEATGSE